MSDFKAYDIKKSKLVTCKYSSILLKDFIINHSKELLGINIIGTNICVDNNAVSNDNMELEVLGYDQSYKLVLFEFRKDKYQALVKKGFMIIDYFKNNIGKAKVLLKKYISDDIINNLNFNMRLICIGNDFSDYDEYALKQTPYEVDLLKSFAIDNIFIIDKVFQSYKVKIDNFNIINQGLFKRFHEAIMDLGDEVNATGDNNYINYRKIKNFCYIVFNGNEFTIGVRLNEMKTFSNVSDKDFDKVMKNIYKAYEENFL